MLTLTQEEAVPESLKNVLLVMANGGYLVPSSTDDTQRRLWHETSKRLDRLLPGLIGEIFPDTTAAVAPAAAPAAAAAAPPAAVSSESAAGKSAVSEPAETGLVVPAA